MSKSPYQVFHSSGDNIRNKIHVVLVRPEQGANVGSAARALANMGITGSLRVVGSPQVVDSQCRKLARHARDRVDSILHFTTLTEALGDETSRLTVAATARIGSPLRPHPLTVRNAMQRTCAKLLGNEIDSLYLVFGPESDGLTNDEVAACDWIATIPSSEEYRSLNLAQSVLVFCHEVNMFLVEEWKPPSSVRPSQKERLLQNILQLAEESGFVLPNDPYKMKPRLETLLSGLPKHIQGVATWHGLLDQIRRSLRKGSVDYKGRFKQHTDSVRVEELG